uniref:Sensors of blue-light using FAD n=1 Tax=Naegleria fowleri TaxID=5763 RepID=A0A182C3J6_NAEFO|nr:sensors of blue-light using FAD [Naegleria fowleri]
MIAFTSQHEPRLLDMHSPEIIQFLESVEALSQASSLQEVLSNALTMIKVFVTPCAIQEINIGAAERNALIENFNRFLSQHTDTFQSLQELTPSLLFDFLSIFEEARITVTSELKQDIFPRFVRSKRFLDFLDGLPPQKEWASDLSSINTSRSLATLFTNPVSYEYYWRNYQADCSNQFITVEDLKFVHSLTLDSSWWKLLKEGNKKKKEYYTSFVSQDAHQIIKPGSTEERDANPQKLFKCSGVIGYSVEELLFTLSSPYLMMTFDNPLSVIEQLDYLNPYDVICSTTYQPLNTSSNDTTDRFSHRQEPTVSNVSMDSFDMLSFSEHFNDEHFPTTICTETYPFGWPITNRDFVVSQTIVYEAKSQRYILVKKSVSHPLFPKRRGTIRAFTVGGWSIQRVTEKQTRFCFVSYTDMDMNDVVFLRLCKKRGKKLFDGLNDILTRNARNGFPRPMYSCGLLNTLSDFIDHFNLPKTVLQENGVEFLKLQCPSSALHGGHGNLECQARNKFKSFEIEDSLVRLVYISRYDPNKLDSSELSKIAQVSIKNNSEKHISGLLLCCEGVFCQVLEGEPEVVHSLMHDKIVKDPRHYGIVIVREENGVKEYERFYSGWAMNTVDLIHCDNYLAQFVRRIIETASKLECFQQNRFDMSEQEVMEIICQSMKKIHKSSQF